MRRRRLPNDLDVTALADEDDEPESITEGLDFGAGERAASADAVPPPPAPRVPPPPAARPAPAPPMAAPAGLFADTDQESLRHVREGGKQDEPGNLRPADLAQRATRRDPGDRSLRRRLRNRAPGPRARAARGAARDAARRSQRRARAARASGGGAERGAARAARGDRAHPARAARAEPRRGGAGHRAGSPRPEPPDGCDAEQAERLQLSAARLRISSAPQRARELAVAQEDRLAAQRGAETAQQLHAARGCRAAWCRRTRCASRRRSCASPQQISATFSPTSPTTACARSRGAGGSPCAEAASLPKEAAVRSPGSGSAPAR